MKTTAELLATSRCVVCERTPVSILMRFIPVSDEFYTAVMRLRDSPLPDGCTPAFTYGLCREHASDLGKSERHFEKLLLLAAAGVVTQ